MPAVLVIDDSPDIRRLLTRALTNEDYTVYSAEDGHSAIETIKKIENACVILLDLMMPGMDGFEFLKWKKNSSEKAREWPVIILSASTHREVPDGAKLILRKPVDLNELLDAVASSCHED